MKETNVLLLLTPKTELAVLDSETNLRQALEKMHANGFMAIPVINSLGEYCGTISEGDLLYKISDDDLDMDSLEEYKVGEILRKEYTPAVRVDAKIEEVIKLIIEQNFVPVVDDRNILMGIITRKSVIQILTNDYV